MAHTVGRAFKIKKSQAKGYGYAKPGFRSNPGVTTIAAINGRGSYRRRGRPVVIATKGLSRNARRARAKKALSSAERKAFALRMAQARKGGKRLGRNASKRVVLKRAKRKTSRIASPLKSRTTSRRRKSGVKAATRKTPMKRKRKASKATTKRRRKSSKRRASTKKTVTRKRKTRKGKRRAKASSKKLRRNKRRKATTKRKTSRKRRSRKASAAAPKRRSRKAGKRKARKTKRKSSKRKSKSSKRSRAARKAARTRKRNASAKLKPNRRKHRKNRRSKRRVSRRRKSYASNRRRSSSRKSHRKNRRHRRNGRRRSAFMRKNGVGDVLKTGLVLFAGFAAHRVGTNLLANNVLSRVFGSASTPAATSGLESLQPYTGAIASVLMGLAGGFIANSTIKDESTKKLVVGGIALSALHGVAMSVFQSFMPRVAGMLAGPEDGTAARISAMYGLRGGESIQPRYAAIGRGGMGEYFAQPMSGMGEYFAQPMGEYIAASGLGSTYEPAGYEAAAGVGVVEVPGNHIDPSSDLDRQLTIAEAAAGVGAVAPFEAAAGIQPFEASAGLGAISRVGSESTWIPGTSDGQLWAGVRAVNQTQGANEMVPAGVLETPGGQGIFG